jgi:hypothetical protein
MIALSILIAKAVGTPGKAALDICEIIPKFSRYVVLAGIIL